MMGFDELQDLEMMEPIATPRGVLDVSTAEAAPIAGENPIIPLRPVGADRARFIQRTSRVNALSTTDADGFDSFYAATRVSVGRALALTLRDVDLANESVDEALARAVQRWDRVGQLDNPAGWVYRVGLNHARSRVRRLTRRPPPSAATVEFTIADPAIGRGLDELSVDHRAVVVCRLLLGWSEHETAVALNTRPGTVKSRLSRALRHLEQRLHHLRPEES